MNVVVLAAHGLNCHWLGPYGNEWMSTPAIDALACESIVFDRHFADDPSPAGFANCLPADAVRSLQNAGTFAAFLDDRKQFLPDGRPWNLTVKTESASNPTPGDALLASAKSVLGKVARHPSWLLWIETDRLLPPWDFEFETYQQYADASGGFIEERSTEGEEPIDEPIRGPFDPHDESLWHRLHNSFAAAVTSFDAEMAAMIGLFRKRRLDQSAAWMFTSGFGWPLGEHGVVGPDGSRMHEELVHLPLIVRLPEGREAMRRVNAFTQTSDIAATILELFGIAPSTPSLVPLMTGKPGFACDAVRISTQRAEFVERGLRTSEWAFLPEVAGQPARLYRKPDDIWEVNDVSLRSPDEIDRLSALLNQKEIP